MKYEICLTDINIYIYQPRDQHGHFPDDCSQNNLVQSTIDTFTMTVIIILPYMTRHKYQRRNFFFWEITLAKSSAPKPDQKQRNEPF